MSWDMSLPNGNLKFLQWEHSGWINFWRMKKDRSSHISSGCIYLQTLLQRHKQNIQKIVLEACKQYGGDSSANIAEAKRWVTEDAYRLVSSLQIVANRRAHEYSEECSDLVHSIGTIGMDEYVRLGTVKEREEWINRKRQAPINKIRSHGD